MGKIEVPELELNVIYGIVKEIEDSFSMGEEASELIELCLEDLRNLPLVPKNSIKIFITAAGSGVVIELSPISLRVFNFHPKNSSQFNFLSKSFSIEYDLNGNIFDENLIDFKEFERFTYSLFEHYEIEILVE